jgi:hypothetical protein
VALSESVAVTVKVDVPTIVGVPVMLPLDTSVNPVGKDPLVTANVYGPVPPVAANVFTVPGFSEKL